MSAPYHLTCHCGGVALELDALDLKSARRCDCSYCRRRGAMAMSVPLDKLRVAKDETLKLYQFNTKSAEHYFCGRCGNYTHHRRRSNPNEYGVNVGGIEGLYPPDFDPVQWVDGVNHPSDKRALHAADWSFGDFHPLGEAITTWRDAVIGILPQDHKGRLLLQFRDDVEGLAGAGQWALFGGHIEAGETMVDAIAREVFEELGISLDKSALSPFAIAPSMKKDQPIFAVTSAKPIEAQGIRLGEGAGFGFFTSAQLNALDIVPSIRPIITHFQSTKMGR